MQSSKPVFRSVSHNNLIQLNSLAQTVDKKGEPDWNPEPIQSRVLAERTICYCSNFDLNFNEWLLAKENLVTFG
jgi:hypothetical protein